MYILNYYVILKVLTRCQGKPAKMYSFSFFHFQEIWWYLHAHAWQLNLKGFFDFDPTIFSKLVLYILPIYFNTVWINLLWVPIPRCFWHTGVLRPSNFRIYKLIGEQKRAVVNKYNMGYNTYILFSKKANNYFQITSYITYLSVMATSQSYLASVDQIRNTPTFASVRGNPCRQPNVRHCRHSYPLNGLEHPGPRGKRL